MDEVPFTEAVNFVRCAPAGRQSQTFSFVPPARSPRSVMIGLDRVRMMPRSASAIRRSAELTWYPEEEALPVKRIVSSSSVISSLWGVMTMASDNPSVAPAAMVTVADEAPAR